MSIQPPEGLGTGKNLLRMQEALQSADGSNESPMRRLASTIVERLPHGASGYDQIRYLAENGKPNNPLELLNELKSALDDKSSDGKPLVKDSDVKTMLEAINFETPINTTFFSCFTRSGGMGKKRLRGMLTVGIKFHQTLSQQEADLPSSKDLTHRVSVKPSHESEITSSTASRVMDPPSVGKVPCVAFKANTKNYMDGDPVYAQIKIGDSFYMVRSLGISSSGKIKGRGTFGRVLIGSDIKTGKKVAIKITRAPKREILLLNLLQKESKLQLRVNSIGSDHLLGASAIGEHKDPEGATTIFTVMKPQDGGEFHDRIAKNLPTRDALQVLRDAAEGLEALHANGIVHLDIKPRNVMCHGNPPRGTVIDYGLALKEHSPANRGTPGYMDPALKQAKKENDVYSFGAMIFYTFSKDKPSNGLLDFTLRSGLAMEDLDPRMSKTIKCDIFNLIKDCINPILDKRPTISCVKERLNQILQKVEGAST